MRILGGPPRGAAAPSPPGPAPQAHPPPRLLKLTAMTTGSYLAIVYKCRVCPNLVPTSMDYLGTCVYKR